MYLQSIYLQNEGSKLFVTQREELYISTYETIKNKNKNKNPTLIWDPKEH